MKSSRPRPATSPVRDRSAVPSWAVALGLALLCIIAYANSFSTGFTLDSHQLILKDPRVHAATAANLSAIAEHTYWWPYGESGLYRPLTTLSYLFNYAVLGNGERPAGYHGLNLLLHIVNTVIVWRLARRITGSEWIGAVAGALWAVLPLSTEAVTNLAGRADLVAAAGSMTAVLLYIDGRLPALAPIGAVRSVAIAAALLAGVLAKESALATIGVLLAAEAIWWTPRISPRRLATVAAACVVPLAWWAWQRHAVLAAAGAAEFPFTDNPIVGAPFWQGRLTAVEVMWRYVALMFWPAHLSNDYSFAQIPLATGSMADWLAAVLLAGGALAGLWQLRRHRPAVFFAAFAFIMFLPVSNLLFTTGTIMGERLVYLPSAGLAALVAIGLDGAAAHRRRLAVTAIAAAAVAACTARTLARNPDWTDDVTLWRSAVAAAPASAKAHRALAEALYDSDPAHTNLDAVIAEADRSVALLDTLPDEQNTFQAYRQAGAYYLDKANRVVSARSRSTGSSSGSDAELRRLYSRALHLLDRAVVIARAGARALPGGSVEPEADAQRLRAAALLGLDNPSLALVAARRARELSPMVPLAYHLSAQALLAMERDEEAVMTLLTGSIVTGDRSLGQEAMTVYAGGLDAEGCAVLGSGTGAALNQECPLVRRDSCIASAAAYQVLAKAGQTARAGQIRTAAVQGLACPADLMDRPNSLVP